MGIVVLLRDRVGVLYGYRSVRRDCVGVLYGYRSVIERLCRSVVWVS